MSNLCLFDLSKNHLISDFKKLNCLAKELTQFALDNNFAVFFNSYDYGVEIISEAKMNSFFLVSDSFIYKNCEFLNTCDFERLDDYAYFKAQFIKKFNFLKEVLNILFNNEILFIDIYITSDGSANSIKDFETVKCKSNEFIESLCACIVDGVYFPSVKFEIVE